MPPQVFVGDINDAKVLEKTGCYLIVDCTTWDDIPALTGTPRYNNAHKKLLEKAHEVHTKIKQAEKENKKVLIHCMAGVNRSCATAITYKMLYDGMNLSSACGHWKRKRPQGNCGPENSFWNFLVWLAKAKGKPYNMGRFNEKKWFARFAS